MFLKDLLIPENIKIIDAMLCLDNCAKKILFVTDGMKLRAALSDGDIRRWLLNKGSLDAEVSKIANYNPKYLNVSEKSKALAFMKQKKIDALPILDNNGNIADIVFIDDETVFENKINPQALSDVPLVIMAGGKGTRLYPYTEILPKPLIPIGEQTITEHIISRFGKYGCKDFSMIVNYKKELIKAFFSDSQRKIRFYDEPEFRGTAGGLKLLSGSINKTFFMTNCDILIDGNYEEIYRHHKESKNIITMVCAFKKEVIPYGTIEADENGQIKKLTEKPSFEFLINTGFYIIEPEFLENIPPDTFIHITDVIQQCVNKGLHVGVYTLPEDNWMDMGQLDELKKMREKLGVY